MKNVISAVLAVMIVLGSMLAANGLMKKFSTKNTVSTPKYGAIVRLVSPEENNRTYCTGFVIDNKTVLTAAHCVAMVTPMGIFVAPVVVIADEHLRKIVPSKTTYSNYNWELSNDLAVIKGNFTEFKKLKVDFRNDPQMGTKFNSYGYGLGGALHKTNCKSEGYYTFFLLSLNCNLIQGMSGGPSILEDGETVIGINSRVMGNMQMFSPTINIDQYLELNQQ